MKPLSFLSLAALWLAACTSDGTKTGNGVTLEFATEQGALTSPELLTYVPPEDGLSTTDTSGTRFDIETARLSVTRLRVELPSGGGCSDPFLEKTEAELVALGASFQCDGDQVDARGGFLLDLVGLAYEPPLDRVPFPSGVYSGLDIDVDPYEGSGLGSDNTIEITGQFEYETESVSFSLQLHRTENLRFESEQALNLDDGERMFAVLRVDDWFRSLPIIDCLEQGELSIVDGHLDIQDSGSCSEIENELVDAIRASTRLDR